MVKALHIYAVGGKSNSGDFFLGPATKSRFESIVEKEVQWKNFDVRKTVTQSDVDYFNTFDYLVIGGGGLFLPDTNPNKVSCWQWGCSENFYSKIEAGIYIIAVGWNHFYGQDITMPSRNSILTTDMSRHNIFRKNISSLLENSAYFTMRHNGDCEKLKQIVEQEHHKKINFEFCPVINYIKDKYASGFKSGGIYHAFEIKDDRPQRRYLGTTIQKVYQELLVYIRYLLEKGEKIAVMSHDGSRSFAGFLKGNGVPFVLLNNTVANEQKIIENYSQVKKLYCTAGHSQMTAYALGLPFHSLIGHDKLEYFLKDTDNFDEDRYTYINDNDLAAKIALQAR
jgi:hypothetical protein